MRNIFLLLCLLPIFASAQLKPNSSPKTSPAVAKLVEKAFQEYQNSKDDDCKKTIQQIQKLDPNNRDAFLILANLAMFEKEYENMWSNLNIILKKNPKETDVYSNFVMSHINNFVLPDSIKAVMCRRSIKLNSAQAEPYATLGMVAAISGYYKDAIVFFELSEDKYWKDINTKPVIMLTHARCLYSNGDTILALDKVNQIYENAKGSDKYTSLFLRTKYRMDLGDLEVKQDIDTLNTYAFENIEIKKLNVTFLSLSNKKDSACKLAKIVRFSEGGESYDISSYCSDLEKSIDLYRKYKTLIYSSNEADLTLKISRMQFSSGIDFKWQRMAEMGAVKMNNKALDSSTFLFFDLTNKTVKDLTDQTSFWLSKNQFCELETNRITKIAANGKLISFFRIVGREQIEVFDEKSNEFLLDCVVISDGVSVISYLNDVNNPLIVKIKTEDKEFVLTKIE